MRALLFSMPARLVGTVVLGSILVLGGGCDSGPAPETRRPPSVSGLQIVPDSIHESDPSVQVRESSAVVSIVIDSVRATDPDGSVARVVFAFEPSSNPRATISGELRPLSRSVYGDTLVLGLPLVDEVYTVRAFAVDDDSLSSNQVTGQFRFVPADTANGGSDRHASSLVPRTTRP